MYKRQEDTYGSSVSIVSGNNGVKNVYARQGGSIGKTDYRLSITQKTDGGFDEKNDDRISQFVDLETHRVLDSVGELQTSLVYLTASKELSGQVEPYQTNQNEIDEERFEAAARWTRDLSSKHQLQVRTYVTQYNQRQAIDVAGVPVAYLDDNLRELFLSLIHI